MKTRTRILLGASAVLLSAQALAQITFYEGQDFHGRAFTTNKRQPDFRRYGFNDRASSVVVDSGRWEVCEDPGYEGRCVILREGSYDSLKRMGVNNRISSARRIGRDSRRDDRDDYYEAEPLPQATYEYRRRPNERVYEADVTSVHAVMGRPEEHCWIERERVDRGGASVAGGIVGGVIGGILGHQIGRGTGRDVATVGGAAAGAAIGANAGRQQGADRDVRHCEAAQSGPPDYWDVTYRYRGVEHHVQMTQPPGDTILVNRDGEPRQ